MRGVEAAIDAGWVGTDEWVLDTEPTDNQIQVAHKGRTWFELISRASPRTQASLGKEQMPSQQRRRQSAISAAASRRCRTMQSWAPRPSPLEWSRRIPTLRCPGCMHHVDRHAIGTSGNHGEGGNDSSAGNREGAARGSGHPRHLPHHGRSSSHRTRPRLSPAGAPLANGRANHGGAREASYFTAPRIPPSWRGTCSNHP